MIIMVCSIILTHIYRHDSIKANKVIALLSLGLETFSIKVKRFKYKVKLKIL